MTEIIQDEPCPYCEGDKKIPVIDLNEPFSFQDVDCPACHGTGLLIKDYPEQDEVSEEGRGKI
jgi:DnaJ-class molecular chaperone